MNLYQSLFEQQKRYFCKYLKNSSAEQRVAKIKKIRNWLFEHQQEIRDALYKDFRKPAVDVDLTEIKAILLEIDYTIKHLKKWMTPARVGRPLILLGSKSYIRYESKGVALIISPWNFPFLLTVGPLVSAIAAGNCAFIKPSEISENSSRLLEKMVNDLFAKEEVTLIKGDSKVAENLTQLPFDHIFFTGSTRVGKLVMQAAAKNLTTVTLELGGQNPAIVDETARLKDTAQRLLFGKLLNTGQACVAPNFIFVHETVKDKLVHVLQEELEKRFPGAKKNNPDFSRIINKANFERIKSLIDDAVTKGAEPVTALEFDEDEKYIAPVILKNTPLKARLFDEEIFGPVIALAGYEKIETVINFINKKPAPLAFYIFSQSKKNIEFALNNTCSGTAAVNETTIQFGHPGLPFGGHNQSGLGKSHGYYGFIEFSNQRSVLKQRNGFTMSNLVQPPYTDKVKKLVELTLKYF